jgi:hypothetical protein
MSIRSALAAFLLFLMAATVANGAPFIEPTIGARLGYQESNAAGGPWDVNGYIVGQVTIGSFDYFDYRVWNAYNDQSWDTFYFRATEDEVLLRDSNNAERTLAMEAPVGTSWADYSPGVGPTGLDWSIGEVVYAGPVSVPYGDFDQGYTVKSFWASDSAGADASPPLHQTYVRGVGLVREQSEWLDPAPTVRTLHTLSLPGDLNYDDEVSFLEAATVVASIGSTTAMWELGDFDLSGQVDLADAQWAVDNYVDQHPSSNRTLVIPEPCSLLLLTAASLGFAIHRLRYRDRP